MYNREVLRVKKNFLYYLVLLSKILVRPKSPYTSVQTVQVKGHCRIRTSITLMSEDGEKDIHTQIEISTKVHQSVSNLVL